MKEHPILFSAPMVRALLNGSKTQTRRVVKFSGTNLETFIDHVPNKTACCPYGQPGDRLWVRETWRHIEGGAIYDAAGGTSDSFDPETIYRADRENYPGPWKPSIFMPRWASRIILEITAVRVERLLKISEADAKAEGAQLSEGPCTEPEFQSYTLGYLNLWNSINGPDSWASNPWVWVIEFKVVTP